MVYPLTELGRVLWECRRLAARTMADQSRETGRPACEISWIERGRCPLPAIYIEEFAQWAGVNAQDINRLRQLSSASLSQEEVDTPADGDADSFLKSISNSKISSEAEWIRTVFKIKDSYQFSLIRLLELEAVEVWPELEIHIEPAAEMGDVEAYVATFPLRVVISDRTYHREFTGNVRARFTLAHELAHIVLHRNQLNHPDAKAARQTQKLDVKSGYEVQANKFAGAFLLPEKLVRKFGADTETISKAFGVSRTAAANRIAALQIPKPKIERVVTGFRQLNAKLSPARRNRAVREESWGNVIYDPSDDTFYAEVKPGHDPIPEAPLGMSWIYTGICDQECIHCYGNFEDLPRGILSDEEASHLIRAVHDAGIMRVVISGGEPLLHPGIEKIVDQLAEKGTSVILGTNGSHLSAENLPVLKKCSWIEISLDASNPTIHNEIRPTRKPGGDAWAHATAAIHACLMAGVNVRVLTAINSRNQHDLVALAKFLRQINVKYWALSSTIPAGRAAKIFDYLAPNVNVVEKALEEIHATVPGLNIRHSFRTADTFDRYYFMVLPNAQIATENLAMRGKQTFGSALEIPLLSAWTDRNFNRRAHFKKWVAGRIAPLA